MLYQNFGISSEEDGYRLSDSNFTEDRARGGLYFSITMRFSTRDRDNDDWSRVYRVEYKTVSGTTMTEEAGSCLFVYWGFRVPRLRGSATVSCYHRCQSKAVTGLPSGKRFWHVPGPPCHLSGTAVRPAVPLCSDLSPSVFSRSWAPVSSERDSREAGGATVQ